MTQNVITQTVITPQLQVCLTWSIFFSTRTSEQHTATADLVNFFIISYRFRLNIQTSSGSLNKIVLELILQLMVIVQIKFQRGCNCKNTHKNIMYRTMGNMFKIYIYILCSLFIQFEHSLDWVESLVGGVHYWHIASLTTALCSLSTLVTPQSNLTMCNRTSCAQVQELP